MIPNLDKLETNSVVVENRKLKARWSMENQQDLRALHNADASAQLSDILAKELLAEIDNEILADLRDASGILNKFGKKKKYRSIDDPWEN